VIKKTVSYSLNSALWFSVLIMIFNESIFLYLGHKKMCIQVVHHHILVNLKFNNQNAGSL